MTVIRKRTGDKGGCCDPISELQLEIERVDQTAIDAKTTANNAEAMINANIDKINDAIAIIPQVQTNTEAIAEHGTELTNHDARIHTNTIVNDQQNTDIASLKSKTNNNAVAIKALEDEVGPETVAGTIKYRLKDIDSKLPTAIKEVEMIANASTVTHKATHISGTTESDALPIVSREQAGIMSASVYAAMEDVIANNTSRISVLEQSAPTYDISGLVSANPTNAEISTAFTQKYPNVPIQAGLRAADYDNAHFWQYGKGTWILLTQIDVQMATNQSLGIVKGSDTNGKVFVETDGSMSLKGYDALVSNDATHSSKINTLEVGLGNANARIDATNTNVANNAADIVAANGNISTNTNDINGLKSRMATAEGQIATHETKINQHTQSINDLTADVNNLKNVKTATNNSLGVVKGSEIDGKVTVESDGSMSLKGYDAIISGIADNDREIASTTTRLTSAEGQITTQETKINQHTQTINNLASDVNNLTSDVNNLKNKTRTPKVYTGPIENLITYNSNNNTVKVTKEMIVVYWSRSTQMGIHTSHILPQQFTMVLSNVDTVYIDKFLSDKFNDYSKFIISGIRLFKDANKNFAINVSIGGQTATKTNSLNKDFIFDKETYYMIYTFD